MGTRPSQRRLIETIALDFLIKALNKKIRADCLIKENAPSAPKSALLNLSSTFRGPELPGTCTGAYSKGPEPLVIQGFGASSLYAPAYTLTSPKTASQQCRQATLRLLHAAHELLDRLVHQEQ